MKSYSNIHSRIEPVAIDVTKNQVFINKNIHTFSTEEFDGYEYDVEVYDKDEYLALLIQNQTDVESLKEELEATKILLGVE